MIRFTVSGQTAEIKVWRLAVFLAWFGLVSLWFDVLVWNAWIDLPVEVAYGALIEWMFPTFGLYAALGSAVEALRELRRLRAELEAGD